MTSQEALGLAGKFVDSYNGPRSADIDYKLGIGEMTEFTYSYHFEIIIVHLNGEPYVPPPVASSPIGLVISKHDGKAKKTDLYDLHQLKNEERRMDHLFALLTGIRENKGGLDIIKSRYQLSSRELLLFKKELQQAAFNRLTVSDILQELINKIKQ
jgi:hypothetical protein